MHAWCGGLLSCPNHIYLRSVGVLHQERNNHASIYPLSVGFYYDIDNDRFTSLLNIEYSYVQILRSHLENARKNLPHMPFCTALEPLVFLWVVFPSVLAKGGKGGGGKGDGGPSNVTVSSNLSLAPLLAAAFAFYVIFAIFAALEALIAAANISRRISKQPPSITLSEYSVGPIFPTSLLLSTLTFMVFNVLNAISIGLTENQNVSPFDRPELTQSYFTAVSVMGYLTETLLVTCAFALLAHRETILVITPPMVRGIKIIFDTALTAALFSLSMAFIGLSATALTTADEQIADNLYLAYHSLLLVAVVDIAVSSTVLHFRARHSPVNDHKVREDFNSNPVQNPNPSSYRALSSLQPLSLLSSSPMLCTRLFSGASMSVELSSRSRGLVWLALLLVVLSVPSLSGNT